jgi:putative component of membrane protein insertase Oxa1/YidC/SpoIIIJ protein YidD
MAAGAWSGVALLAATIVNANPFRREGFHAQPRHFDPYQLLTDERSDKPKPQIRVRVSQLRHLFDKTTRG